MEEKENRIIVKNTHHPAALAITVSAIYLAFMGALEVLGSLIGLAGGGFISLPASLVSVLYDALLTAGFVLFAIAPHKPAAVKLMLPASICLTAGTVLQTIKEGYDAYYISTLYYYSSGSIAGIVIGSLLQAASMALILVLVLKSMKTGTAGISKSAVPALIIAAGALAIAGSVVFRASFNIWWSVSFDVNMGMQALVAGAFAAACIIYLTDHLDDNLRVRKAEGTDPDTYIGVNMAHHVLLLIFTGGVWHYVTVFRMTKYLNRTEGQLPMRPLSQTLLNLIPFYSIYWAYRHSKKTDALLKSSGMRSDTMAAGILLGIFFPGLMTIPFQSKLNLYISPDRPQGPEHTAPGHAEPQAVPQSVPAPETEPENTEPVYVESQAVPQSVPEPSPQPAAEEKDDLSSNVEKLKKYKELLDMGIITQEEFDSKKSDLLDL